ncbi:FHA domain-containing protein [Dyella jiangningensis]|uniref:Forkhead-associated protein n=1 Tax=Dyella jiangningensis TaxID=1379159 RepID=A0A328P326_9GAMM|nr:FHA domain-containing protein [Dyella jiangningensis]RAO76598.1 forkhead-associated protein [Dyella jiangningensis]
MDNPRNVTPSASSRRPSGPQGTRLFSTDELNRLADEAGAASTGSASVHEPVLEGANAGLEGRRFSLRAGRQTIGRRDDNDIVIGDLSVSSAHAWIMNQQGHYVIMNTLSTNGTFVNGKRVHEATLKHGDRVRLGQVEFVFLTREPGQRSPMRSVAVAVGVVVVIAAVAALAWWLL